jgi:hypothetical protein
MLKRTNQILTEENEALKKQVKILQTELDDLNENTIISSMNDMKRCYEDLVANSVCNHRFNYLKSYCKRYFNIIRTLDMINKTIFDNLIALMSFINNYSDEYDETSKEARIKFDITSTIDRVQLMSEIIHRDSDEWEDQDCMLHHNNDY